MRRVLPLAILLVPAPALADVTAHYDTYGQVLSVEVDDGGNVRAGIDGDFVLIRRDDIDYIVIYSHDGAPHVARADAALSLLNEKVSPPAWSKIEILSAGDAAVAGYAGSVWNFGPAGQPPLELVLSPDPELTPIGAVFERVVYNLAQVIDAHGAGGSDAAEGALSLFSQGTPIRARDVRTGESVLTLRSVSNAEIDSHRFDLPGPVIDAEALYAAVRPDPPAPPTP